MKYTEIISKMTLEEKARFMSGKNTWETMDYPKLGIPNMKLSDGPHGMRVQAGAGDHLGINASLPATCFPTAATIANSWNTSLGEEIGQALGEEAMSMGVGVILGPGLNIKRSPLCGRNFEYFSEDPYLAGKMAAAYVKGIQSKGIAACPKHFAVNSQEMRRMAMDSVVDERTLREIYLQGFELAVKEGGAKSIMTSYNEVNGTYANENEHLLQDILYGEWGYDGFVVSDWGGSNDHALGVKMGSHLEMPSTGDSGMKDILKAIEAGELTEEELDKRVDELLEVVFATNESIEAYKKGEGSKYDSNVKAYDVVGHNALARKAAAESIVLLKNENQILPLSAGKKVAIIGDFAKKSRYQGAGSSLVNTSVEPENIWDELNKRTLDYEIIGFAEGYKRNAGVKNGLIKEAVELAKKSEICIIFAGLDEISESEGLDRKHMRMPEAQDRLIEAVSEVNSNIVVVLSAGSPVEMPWYNNVAAIVHGYLWGQAGASAMLDVLHGKVNPSGKLNESYAVRYEDTPAHAYWPSKERSSEHREGPYVGYRYYDKAGVEVQFPFGFGLSYTNFEYTNYSIEPEGISFAITNTGNMDGMEIAQLYVGRRSESVYRPSKELKGFKKVFVRAQETVTVSIPFDDMTFRYYDTVKNSWEVETGIYEIMLGASSRDIRFSGTHFVEGTVEKGCFSKKELPSYFKADIKNVSDEEFQTLYGKEIPDGKWKKQIQYNDAVCQLGRGRGILGWIYYGVLKLLLKIADMKGKPSLNLLFQYNMPIRGYAKMTGGFVTTDMAKALTEMANGHRIKGTAKLIKAMVTRS